MHRLVDGREQRSLHDSEQGHRWEERPWPGASDKPAGEDEKGEMDGKLG